MSRKTKKIKEIENIVKQNQSYTVEEAIDVLKKCPKAKFDESIELSMKMGVDPKKSDQQVRGTVALPHGTGKTMIVVVFAKGDKIKEALDAGADFAGADELLDKVKKGWTQFDAVISTPDMMREVGKLGKILGPRGLMPTPKAGTVTPDVKKAVTEVKGGKIEFKVDKSSVINNSVGKVSFDKNKLIENVLFYFQAIMRAKPQSAKGVYLKSLFMSSTMGPGLKIDIQSISTS